MEAAVPLRLTKNIKNGDSGDDSGTPELKCIYTNKYNDNSKRNDKVDCTSTLSSEGCPKKPRRHRRCGCNVYRMKHNSNTTTTDLTPQASPLRRDIYNESVFPSAYTSPPHFTAKRVESIQFPPTHSNIFRQGEIYALSSQLSDNDAYKRSVVTVSEYYKNVSNFDRLIFYLKYGDSIERSIATVALTEKIPIDIAPKFLKSLRRINNRDSLNIISEEWNSIINRYNGNTENVKHEHMNIDLRILINLIERLAKFEVNN